MATADLGAIEICGGLVSLSPLMDLRRALRESIVVSIEIDMEGGRVLTSHAARVLQANIRDQK